MKNSNQNKWDWQSDLMRNSHRNGRLGAIIAFFFDPGFSFVVWVRFFHFLKNKKGWINRLLASFVFVHITKTFASDISFESISIGHGLKVPHPFGIVIGQGSIIGNNVTILQHTTIGRKNVSAKTNIVRIEDNVILGAHAIILGPLVVGAKSKVGAGAVVLTDVSPNETVVGNPARPVK